MRRPPCPGRLRTGGEARYPVLEARVLEAGLSEEREFRRRQIETRGVEAWRPEEYGSREKSMAYDPGVAQRLREALQERQDIREKKMFGGLAFLLGGNMCCGVVGDEIMVRVGAEAYEAALNHPHARKMDFTGQPLRGFVYVAAEGIEDDEELEDWVQRGVDFAASLPPK
ncbi:MAG: TfoX/Sxy family protein [Acidobacteriota bacterium]|nr:TfoX/Sxy family protein [Acidobacteriota bacterium]